jgi:hypothetical protein
MEEIVTAWNEAWLILTTTLATNLWAKRNDRVFNNLQQPIKVQATQIFKQSYQQLESIAHFRRKERVSWLWWVVKHMKDPTIPAILTNHLRLFYDGGSRGNPGEG